MRKKKILVISLAAALCLAAIALPLIRALTSPRDQWPTDEEMMQSTDSALVASMRNTRGQEVERDIRRILENMPHRDQRTLDKWDRNARNSPKAVRDYVSAVQALSPFITQLESTDISSRIAEAVRGGSQSVSSGGVRGAVYLTCEAALGAHYAHNNKAAAEHIVATLRIADAMTPSEDLSYQMTRMSILATSLGTATFICKESAFDRPSTIELLAAIASTQSPEALSQSMRFIDKEIRLRSRLEDYRLIVAVEETTPSFGKKPVSDVVKKTSLALGMSIKNKSRKEVTALQKEDLDACRKLSDLVKSSPPWPYYAAVKNEDWKKVIAHDLFSARLPTAHRLQEYAASTLVWQGNAMATAGTCRLKLLTRLFESQNHRLPADIPELRTFTIADAELSAALGASESFWNDPYSGQPYKYVLAKDQAGKPISLKVYSVGPDLKDNGGKRQDNQTGEEYDIVATAKPLDAVTPGN